jgi:hypothetical protein
MLLRRELEAEDEPHLLQIAQIVHALGRHVHVDRALPRELVRGAEVVIEHLEQDALVDVHQKRSAVNPPRRVLRRVRRAPQYRRPYPPVTPSPSPSSRHIRRALIRALKVEPLPEVLDGGVRGPLPQQRAPEARLFSERDGSRQPGRLGHRRRRRRRTRREVARRRGDAVRTVARTARGGDRRLRALRLCVRGTFGFGGVRGVSARERPKRGVVQAGSPARRVRVESDVLEAGDEVREAVLVDGRVEGFVAVVRGVDARGVRAAARERDAEAEVALLVPELVHERAPLRTLRAPERRVRRVRSRGGGRSRGGRRAGERSAGTPVGMRSVISIARGVAAAGEVASSAKVTDSRVAPRTAALMVSSRGAESASAGDDDSSAPPGAVADGERSPAPAPPARGFFFPDDPRFIAPIATADARESLLLRRGGPGRRRGRHRATTRSQKPRAIQPTAIPPPWRSPRTPRANGDRDAPTSTNPTPRRRRPRAGRTRAPPG